MSVHTKGPDSSKQMEETLWSFLYFHWSGHIIVFGGAFLAAYLTDNHFITAGAILLFIGHLLIQLPVDIIRICRHFREGRLHIPLYVTQYSLYLSFSGILITGWQASYATGQHLYTAVGMLIYAASIITIFVGKLCRCTGHQSRNRSEFNRD
ncbi:MAG: hypothetical protein J6J97_06900 [Akkermansia sp.]|nr:hypothetical protein [Akkermansia sp.]